MGTFPPQLFRPARKGSSAVLAATERSLHAGIKHRNGVDVGATLYDLHKFFDSVRLDVLVKSLIATDLPIIDVTLAVQMHLAPRVILV